MKNLLLLNSKTVSFNVLIPVAMMVCQVFGLVVPEEGWTASALICNFVLRFFTDKPLADK